MNNISIRQNYMNKKIYQNIYNILNKKNTNTIREFSSKPKIQITNLTKLTSKSC